MDFKGIGYEGWTGFFWFTVGASVGLYELSDYIKGGEYLDPLSEYQLLKKDFVCGVG
jgi:hypothetical protein